MGLAWLGWSVLIQNQEREALELDLYRVERQIGALEPKVKELREMTDSLASRGLPNLTLVRADKPVPINQGFASNIRFEYADTPSSRRLNYQLVVHNTEKTAVYLKLDILFYDDRGTQIGVSHIGQGGTGSAAPRMLQGGEMDILTAPIEMQVKGATEADIRHFKLRILD